MKITALTAQQRDPSRINVLVDGKFRFSLDVFQVSDLGIKVGRDYSDKELTELETESQFGKLYARTLEYCLMRPHSSREVRDYLYKKTLAKKYRSKRTGELMERQGVSMVVVERVFDRLREKGYIDDDKFTRFWVENRYLNKGVSIRKLQSELRSKGVENGVIDKYIKESDRNDTDELKKMIERKKGKYPDQQKLMQYLARQGFSYENIKEVLSQNE